MEVPLFPLRLVLFPGRQLPLHLFEDRYLQMLSDLLEGDRRFGVIAIRDGNDVDPLPEVHRVGCLAEVQQVTRLPDGRADIVARGVQRFRLDHRHPPAPYQRATIAPLEDAGDDPDPQRVAALREVLRPYLTQLGAPEELASQLPDSPDHLAWLAAAAAQVDISEQQALLELDSTRERVDETLALLRRETSLMRHFGSVGSLRPPNPDGAELN